MNGPLEKKNVGRREFLRGIGRYVSLGALGIIGGGLWLGRRGGRRPPGCTGDGACADCATKSSCKTSSVGAAASRFVWQLDPTKCIQCGRCATNCVLEPSAVKCVHGYALCGYCKLCFGYFQPNAPKLNENAENQLCPTGAIVRTFVEDPYYQYTIDDRLCIGCGKCVKGCASFGNGSLFLQVNHALCVNCNECAIARGCPANAFRRVPVDTPYIMKPGMDRPAIGSGVPPVSATPGEVS